MPPSYATPGVYTGEVSDDTRGIAGAPTSITAFIGRAWRGPIHAPVAISSAADYAQVFGGAWADAPMAAAVQHYFDNGGAQAVIVRVVSRDPDNIATPARLELASGHAFLAANPGSWGMNLRLTITRDANAADDDTRFDLAVLDDPALKNDSAQRGGSGANEYFANLSMDPASPRYVTTILAGESRWLRAGEAMPATVPAIGSVIANAGDAHSGSDGNAIGFADVAEPSLEATREGMYALLDTDSFNLLCIPPFAPDLADNGMPTWSAASRLCKQRRAFLIVDAPRDWTAEDARAGVAAYAAVERENAALYFPRLSMADPQQPDQQQCFAPCGAVAGIFARTDAQRGVWKAPAGTDAALHGFADLSAEVADAEQEMLNPRGINALRAFPTYGIVTWGARTLAGDDQLSSEWKYIPVRRMALFLEESLIRGTQWAVFETNGEPMWAQLRVAIGSFMQQLFLQGAFQGTTPDEAYVIRCDSATTSQNDIDQGIVNIMVGFAPLKPAEFVMVNIQQITDSGNR
jgi:phage tail sheath protein FI